MPSIIRTGSILVLSIVVLSGCCMFGSGKMIDQPPTVDINRYRTFAVVSVRPMPGDPAVSEVEVRLAKFGAPHGITVIKGDQLRNLQQMMESKLQALQQQANFQQQMADRKRQEEQAIADAAAQNQMDMAPDAVSRQAEYQAYTAASEGISGRYEAEVKQIFNNAMQDASMRLPKIDGLIFVDLKDFGRPSIIDVDLRGIPLGDGHTMDIKYKQVTLTARVGWNVVDPGTGQIIHPGDIYDLSESATAEIGGGYDGTHGSIQFDLSGLQRKLWERVGFSVSENFYPHQVSECEEKQGVSR